MPTLDFKGKQFVYAHHLTCPFRPLVPVAEKSLLPKGGEPDLNGNLIIRGDNLHALKALLPRYAGRVNCIFIDPPYNTGNEGWCYNDNVRSPLMREWLKKAANPVDKEDLERHDKWLCMMWPRLQLLKDLLAEDGAICVFCDDNEMHRLRLVMDEVFGEDHFLASIAWVKRYTRSNNAKMFYSQKDYIVCYRKSAVVNELKEQRNDKADDGYANPDNDPRGDWMTSSYVNPATKDRREKLVYPILRPTDEKVIEHPTHAWKYKPAEHKRHVEEKLLWWGQDGLAEYPRLKLFLNEASLLVPIDVWNYDEVGSSDDGSGALSQIFKADVFDNPKPPQLMQALLGIFGKPDSLILDSFAGSGTTAHAVLAQNKKDGGNRKFILVECEEYADTLTAERVRRVIQGYKFEGTQREELHRENITFTSLKKADKILERVAGYEVTDGHRFDKVKAEVKDGVLTVTGEKKVTERTEGLGGSFTYCELGEAVELESMLTGKALPEYAALASYVFYTATGQTLPKVPKARADGFIGETELFRVHLHYKPDMDWMRSNESALNESLAEAIAKANTGGKRCLVFATGKFMSQKDLSGMKIEFCQLPFAIHRLTGAGA